MGTVIRVLGLEVVSVDLEAVHQHSYPVVRVVQWAERHPLGRSTPAAYIDGTLRSGNGDIGVDEKTTKTSAPARVFHTLYKYNSW